MPCFTKVNDFLEPSFSSNPRDEASQRQSMLSVTFSLTLKCMGKKTHMKVGVKPEVPIENISLPSSKLIVLTS